MAEGIAVGWYGKLPSLGDFASRRLSHDFIEAWDDWLATGIAAWRERDPDGWLTDYLASPSWRFVLMPGSVPGGASGSSAAMAGVLMPSVDRVGRYFPLTLALPLPRLPQDAAETSALLAWLHALDDLAVDALQDEWAIDQLEAELARLAASAPDWFAPDAEAAPALPPISDWLQRAPGAAEIGDFSTGAGVQALLASAARSALAERLRGQTWWLFDDGLGHTRVRVAHGLPAGGQFAALIGLPPQAAE